MRIFLALVFVWGTPFLHAGPGSTGFGLAETMRERREAKEPIIPDSLPYGPDGSDHKHPIIQKQTPKTIFREDFRGTEVRIAHYFEWNGDNEVVSVTCFRYEDRPDKKRVRHKCFERKMTSN